MMTVEKKYIVTLGETDIELLTDALHDLYMKRKADANNDPSRAKLARQDEAHAMRDNFACLIHRSYMGKDA